MYDIELMLLSNFADLRGKGKGVKRVIEKRIVDRLDRMKVHVIQQASQPDGCGTGNKVNLVATTRQAKPEFRGNYPRSADGRVADYSDAHGFGLTEQAIRPTVNLASLKAPGRPIGSYGHARLVGSDTSFSAMADTLARRP